MFINEFNPIILMNSRILVVLLAILLMVSGAFAYSGFNREYYTNYYAPNYYYATPYHSYSTYYPNYSHSTYYPTSYTYYPSYSYSTVYYPNYSYAYYPAYRTTYVSSAYIYPASGRSLSIYSGDSGWGISYSSGSICGIYGYCD